MAVTQKNLVRVTLDILCYDDLDLDQLNWRKLLDLEGDEEVHVTIKDYVEIFS